MAYSSLEEIELWEVIKGHYFSGGIFSKCSPLTARFNHLSTYRILYLHFNIFSLLNHQINIWRNKHDNLHDKRLAR